MKQQAEQFELASLASCDRRRSIDELNLAEFPLAAITHRPHADQKTLVFEDDIFDEGAGQPVHRKLVVSGTEAYGLPTPLDSDVLLVLVYLTNARNRFTERKVHFTRYELVKCLGWDDGGKSYKRLDEALHRWASVTLYYNRAWWDKAGRSWRSRTFHVLESLDLRGRQGRGGTEILSSLVWNEVLFSSFQERNIKQLDLETYLALRSAVARQAYRFLDKRFYRAKRLEFDLRTFACEHIGLGRNYDNAQLKRKLEPAFKELEAIGFLRPTAMEERYAKRGRGQWLVRLQHGRWPEAQAPAGAGPVGELVSRGVDRSVAENLVQQFPAERIAEKLALFDELTGRRDKRISRNPPGFLAEAIRRDFQVRSMPPAETERPPAKPRSPRVSKPPDESPVEPATLAALAYWNELSEVDQTLLEAQAVRAGNRFRVETYRRLQGARNALFEQVRQQLVIEFICDRQLTSSR